MIGSGLSLCFLVMASSYQELEANVRGLIAAMKAGAILEAVRASIGSSSLDGGGKLYPAGLPGGSGIKDLTKPKTKAKVEVKPDGKVEIEVEDGDTEKSLFIPIAKLDNELREVTGVVLQPEVTDAQGDIMSEEVIAKAAGDFLAGFNKTSTLGLMHKEFNKRFELRQSFIAPSDMVIANKTVRKGSWIMVVRVKEATIWKAIKGGKITGFSIGGKAKAQKLVA